MDKLEKRVEKLEKLQQPEADAPRIVVVWCEDDLADYSHLPPEQRPKVRIVEWPD